MEKYTVTYSGNDIVYLHDLGEKPQVGRGVLGDTTAQACYLSEGQSVELWATEKFQISRDSGMLKMLVDKGTVTITPSKDTTP